MKQKVSSVFRFTIDLQKMPLGKLRVVCIRNISKMKSKPAKNTGRCFATQLKIACKLSGAFAEKSMVRHLPLSIGFQETEFLLPVI